MHHSLQQAISDGIHHSRVPNFITVLVRIFFCVPVCYFTEQTLVKLVWKLIALLLTRFQHETLEDSTHLNMYLMHLPNKIESCIHFLSVLQLKNYILTHLLFLSLHEN
jgi:hypothetical protein